MIRHRRNCDSFSGLGIVRRIFRRSSRIQPATTEAANQSEEEEEPVVEQYCAQLFISKSVSEWKVDFVITKDLDTCSTVRLNFIVSYFFIEVFLVGSTFFSKVFAGFMHI